METCDRCGPNVAAAIEVKNPATGQILTFCGHHARVLDAALAWQGFTFAKKPGEDIGVAERFALPGRVK